MSLFEQSADKLRNTEIVLNIDGELAIILVSQLQLALRHPVNNGPSSKSVKQFALMLQNKLRGIDASVDIVLEMGWNPDYDI